MAVDLTILEKYNQLSEVDKDLLRALCGESPEGALLDEDRRLKSFKSYKFGLVAMLVLLSLGATAYDMGLPTSIWTFFGGIFLFFFTGLMLIFFSMLIAEMIFLLLSKILIESTKQHKFMLAVDKKWEEMNRRRQSEIDQARYAEQRVQHEIAQRYQKDFDVIADYFEQGKGFFMPKSLLQFSVDELADFAISRAAMVKKNNSQNPAKISEAVSYYRHLSFLLPLIVEDEVVELEETLRRLNELMQNKSIQESVKSDLLSEYARISTNTLLKSSRDERTNRKYLEKFDEMIGSHL